MQKTVSNELVSLIIFGFNQADIIEATITAAFAQTYPNLEIILSDNCSDDGTFEVMRRMAEAYEGPHRIKLNHNPRNLGFIGHVNIAFELCSGVLIVYNPGDDISLPERTTKLYAAFQKDRPLLIHSDAIEMDDKGQVSGVVYSQKDHLATLSTEDAALSMALGIGATCAWHPDLMRLFGPIEVEETYDDLIFCFRAILADRIVHVPEPLIHYRTGVGMSQYRATTLDDFKAQERKTAARTLDTYKQRLDDCLRYAPESTQVADILDQQIERAKIILLIHEHGPSAVLKNNPSFKTLRLCLSALNRIKKSRRKFRPA